MEEKLEMLLEVQKDITLYNSSSALKQKEKIMKKLLNEKTLTIEEIEKLCQLQKEITELEIESENIKNSSNKITNIINNQGINQGIYAGGNVNISGGNFIIGGATEHQALIEVPSE